ncbi:MAG: carbon-nitrogen hydrolase family protein [Treponema sp.]|jgi:apolipoprotein N-acyltransferase|nr:carbon-nitrogen hydrolase family protein [Treponema sp.]
MYINKPFRPEAHVRKRTADINPTANEKEKFLLFAIFLSVPFMLSFPALSIPAVFVFIYSALTFHIPERKHVFHFALTVFLSLFTLTANGFFMDNPFLWVLMLFYFTAFITLDIYALSYFSARIKFAVTTAFAYIVFTRLMLSRFSFLFPLYYTLQSHYLPFTGIVSKYMLPLLFEALVITSPIAVFQTVKYKKYLSIAEFFIIPVVCMFFTVTYRHTMKIDAPATPLNVGFVQLSFLRQDYMLSDNYPGFGEKISKKYLAYAKKAPPVRLLIIPESSFPYIDFKNDLMLKELKLLAKQNNQYIISGYYTMKKDKIYNSVILISPDGKIADIYSKNSVVPIFESKWATVSNEKLIFNIDGYKIQPLICYETVFMSAYNYRLSNLFTAVSNAVFSEGIAISKLHNAYGIFYARTFNIPYLQITQDGPSFYIDRNYRLNFLSQSGEISYDKVIELFKN